MRLIAVWISLALFLVSATLLYLTLSQPVSTFTSISHTATSTLLVLNTLGCLLLVAVTSFLLVDRKKQRDFSRDMQQPSEWFQVTLSSIGDAVIATDKHGRITFLNAVAETLTGWDREAAQGQPLQQVFYIVNETTRQPVENPALRAIKEGVIVGLANHTVLVGRDGRETLVDDSAAPIRSNGETIGAVLVFRDKSERRKAEQTSALLSGIVESSDDAIISKNLDGTILTWNNAAERLFEYSADEVIGKHITVIIPRDRLHEEQIILERLRNGERIDHYETIRVSKSGKLIDISLTVSPIRNREGEIIGASKIGRDISARRLAEEERTRLLASERAAREQAEAASRAKDEFVATISHEIRSPLNAIVGWAQMLSTGKLDQDETARAIETITRNARIQVKLIEDLLDISRVITGKLNLSFRAVDPLKVIEAALDSIRPAAEAKSIQIDLNLEASDNLVSADPDRLQQICWNLLSNAVKFTPRHGRIGVQVQRVDSRLEFTVKDSGTGIAPEFLPFVFDRFSQANTTTERKYSGLGLGLAIARHLVELHGGAIRAESPGEGQGATFTVAIPLRVVRETPKDSVERLGGPDGLLSSAPALLGLRLLVLDDEAETRELLTTMLQERGAEVRECATADEALATIEQWQPHVVVSDVGMPGEDGYSFIKRLRALEAQRGWNIPAVALTAYARSEDRMRALAAGFRMHVTKPVEALELIVVIASLTGRTAAGA